MFLDQLGQLLAVIRANKAMATEAILAHLFENRQPPPPNGAFR